MKKLNLQKNTERTAQAEPLSMAMKIARIAFITLVIAQTIPILLLGAGSFNQIMIALFPKDKTMLLPCLIFSELLAFAGMVILLVYKIKKSKRTV